MRKEVCLENSVFTWISILWRWLRKPQSQINLQWSWKKCLAERRSNYSCKESSLKWTLENSYRYYWNESELRNQNDKTLRNQFKWVRFSKTTNKRCRFPWTSGRNCQRRSIQLACKEVKEEIENMTKEQYIKKTISTFWDKSNKNMSMNKKFT